MQMALDPLTAALDIGGKLIDKLWPDPAQRDLAKLELLKMQQSGQLEGIKVQMSAIIAEASSSDPWTSRARPSFMYVIYTMLLFGIPMGFLSAFDPVIATNVSSGFRLWLAAIPSDLYTLFGVGYVGYAGARTFDKYQEIKNK